MSAGCSLVKKPIHLTSYLKKIRLFIKTRLYATISSECDRKIKKGITLILTLKNTAKNYFECGGKNSLSDYFISDGKDSIINSELKKTSCSS
jgi:chemotaxis protein methyltransferase CheR